MTGVAEPTGDGFVRDNQKTMSAIASRIAKANPGISPEVLFEAVHQQIGMMNGLTPESRLYMQAAAAQAKDQATLQVQLIKANSATEALQMKIEAQQRQLETLRASMEQIARINAQSREHVASTNAGARVQAAGIGANARVQAAGIGADAREYSADAGTTNAQIGANARVDAATIGMGGKPPVRQAPTARAPRQARAAPAAARKLPAGAKLAPDGNYYVKQGNQYFRVDQ